MPLPRLHLIRLVPQEPDQHTQAASSAESEAGCQHHHPVRLSWAKLLERFFEINMDHGPNCGGELEIIAAILEQPGNREDPEASGSAGRRV